MFFIYIYMYISPNTAVYIPDRMIYMKAEGQLRHELVQRLQPGLHLLELRARPQDRPAASDSPSCPGARAATRGLTGL